MTETKAEYTVQVAQPDPGTFSGEMQPEKCRYTCPVCGRVVGWLVSVNDEQWIEIGGMIMPCIPLAIHSCGAYIRFGRTKPHRVIVTR